MQRFSYSILILLSLAIISLALILVLPPSTFRATPTGNANDAEALIIMGFGFERDASGNMIAGQANSFLLDWSLANYPNIKLMFVQEGIWLDQCQASQNQCFINDVRLRRIDKHNDSLDLRTMDIAVCSIKRMQAFNIKKAVLVAHDAQLWRTQNNIERAKKPLCPDCSFVVANVPDTPYPNNSEQWRNRFEWTYRLIDLAARVRYHSWLYQSIPENCLSPMPDSE